MHKSKCHVDRDATLSANKSLARKDANKMNDEEAAVALRGFCISKKATFSAARSVSIAFDANARLTVICERDIVHICKYTADRIIFTVLLI